MESQGASPIQFGGTRSLRFQRGVRSGGRAGFADCESHTIWWDLRPAIPPPPPPAPGTRRMEMLGMLLVRIAVVGDLSLFFLEIRGMGALEYARYVHSHAEDTPLPALCRTWCECS